MSTTPIARPACEASSEREMPTPQRKDKGRMPAPSSLKREDSDGNLSDDPAPYSGRRLTNKERSSKEKFEPHDTDPTKIEATFRIKMPDGSGWFTQKDVIPEQRDSADEDLYEPCASIFFPDLDSRKVPKKDKEKKNDVAVRWNKVADLRWERTFKGKYEVFTPSIALRRFNARTHAYEHIHIGTSKLNNIDPNNKMWKDAYNKWIDQISRRSNANYQKKKTRDHWTIGEICAMYTAINAFVHENGIDAYDSMSTSDLSAITDAINAVGGKARGLDALRGQITSAHETKNHTMWYLRENAREFRLMIEGGGKVSDEERYPEHIIPLTEFPVEKRTTYRMGMRKTRAGTYKSKFRSVGTQTGDDNVVHDDSDGGVGNKSSVGLVVKKRKRGAPASDSEKEEAGVPDDDSEEEEVEHGYGSEAGETEDDEENNGDAAEDVEVDHHPQTKKPRLAEHAEELARQLLEEGSDEDI
ncbi:uncharacterized protein ALTATR162_LOCUS5137 [Alternaria atra]|uniref:Uncharacterized protein n=1 Tax=Alternaria atra TaxID=119953 RepID=A0A8J2HZE9_9PLEO|nr:uncharacterized protein ALTATR162_LOCUS5137 [Alternaria atra]CAG5158549.1 unnamed protein product [Alternaria atra]